MNMKKVLAVVLAVMLAISAMAITAFAREEVLDLDAGKTNAGAAKASTVNFTIPVYAKYGYAIDGLQITFTLPYFEKNGVKTEYAIVVDGVNYKLGAASETDGTLVHYVVKFGTLAHSWDENETIVPQSTIVGDKGKLELIATYPVTQGADGRDNFRISAANFNRTKDAAENIWAAKDAIVSEVKAVSINSLIANDVIGTSYCFDWNPTDGADKYHGDSNTAAKHEQLQWNATITNKGNIINADSAFIRVTLWKEISGNYYFGAKAQFANGTWYDGGHNFKDWTVTGDAANKWVNVVSVDAPTTVVEIPVSLDALYNDAYGVFNQYLGVEVFTQIHDEMVKTINAIKSAEGTTGSFGAYSWDEENVYFQGTKVTEFTEDTIEDTLIKDIDLVLVYADEAEETPDTEVVPDVDDTVDVEAPVESTEEETEDVEAPAEEEKNPETGVAFALVPAVIALAVVAFKKR